MKLPRNARIFQGQLDVAPFAAVFFLLVMLLVFGSSLVYTPGVRIELPEVPNSLPGTQNPTISVGIDSSGQIHFESQATTADELLTKLTAVMATSTQRFTLVVQADKNVRHERVVQVMNIGRNAGIQEAILATLPQRLRGPSGGGLSR